MIASPELCGIDERQQVLNIKGQATGKHRQVVSSTECLKNLEETA
jgi:hypothetical protein